MKHNRRKFLTHSLSAVAGLAVTGLPHEVSSKSLTIETQRGTRRERRKENLAPVRFSVIGINHSHIYAMVEAMLRGGGQLVSFYAKETDLAAAFTKRYPQTKASGSEKEILEDNSIQLILSSSIPVDRAPLGIQAMQHGKDFLVDKPGIITLDQLAEVRKIQQETKKIYSIMYSERVENRCTVKAGELVKSGAIGQVIQTVGLGPHRMSTKTRPSWFFEKKYYGGILGDIGSHQCDQFLFFTGSTTAEVVASQTGNVHHPEFSEFEDFGDMTVRGDGGTGYIRVDWFTPDGLSIWGDGRLTILGTDGYIELRKYVDINGRAGGNHLFLVDGKETRYFDCNKEPLPFGQQLISDIVNRTETAMTQEHCFLATELALTAQQKAQQLSFKK